MHEQAAEVYRAAGEHHPAYAGALLNPGDSLRQLGRLAEARAKVEPAHALLGRIDAAR